jgi:hypothetical protein
MTTQNLVDLLSGYKSFGDNKVLFTPDEVRLAATLAQQFLLSNLKLLEDVAQLALVAGQERYSFPPVTATAVAQNQVNNFALNLPGHVFHSGDEVIIGATALRRYIVGEVNGDTVEMKDSSVTGSVLAAGNIVYHALYSALEIKDDGIVKIMAGSTKVTGALEKATKSEVELYRDQFGDTSPASDVIRFYQEMSDPMTIGFQGVPGISIIVKVSFYRKPLPAEAITDTQNPIIPYTHDYLLLQATRYFLYTNHTNEAVNNVAEKELEKLTGLMALTRRQHGKARTARVAGAGSFKV